MTGVQTCALPISLNMNKFKRIELEIMTIVPQFDLVNSSFNVICDQDSNPIGVSKVNWRLYEYNFNMHIMEERYNILSFIGGTAGLLYARWLVSDILKMGKIEYIIL